jgi:hypothetical protein
MLKLKDVHEGKAHLVNSYTSRQGLASAARTQDFAQRYEVSQYLPL